MAEQPTIKPKTRSIVTEDDDNCSEFSVISVEEENAEDLEGADDAVRPLSAYTQPSEIESELGDISSEITASVIDSNEAQEAVEEAEAVQRGELLMEPIEQEELVDNQEAQLPTASPDEPEWNPMILSGYMTTSSVVDMMNKVMSESRNHGSALAKIEGILGDLKLKHSETLETKEVEIQRLRHELQRSKERMRDLIRADAKLDDALQTNKRLVAQLQEQCQLNKSLREELDETQDELRQTRVELANQRTIVKVLQEDQTSQQRNLNDYNEKPKILTFSPEEKKATAEFAAKLRGWTDPRDRWRLRRPTQKPAPAPSRPAKQFVPFPINPIIDEFTGRPGPDPVKMAAEKFAEIIGMPKPARKPRSTRAVADEVRKRGNIPGLRDDEDDRSFRPRSGLYPDTTESDRVTRYFQAMDPEERRKIREKVMEPFLDDYSVQPGTSQNAGPFYICECLRAFASEEQLGCHKRCCSVPEGNPRAYL